MKPASTLSQYENAVARLLNKQPERAFALDYGCGEEGFALMR